MRFFLVKEKHVEFSHPLTTQDGYHIRDVTVKPLLQREENSEDSIPPRDWEFLVTLLKGNTSEDGEVKPLSDGNVQEEALDPLLYKNWNLCVAVGIKGKDYNIREFIRVTGSDNGNFLEKIENYFRKSGLRMKFQVEVKDITLRRTDGDTTVILGEMITKDVNIAELSSQNENCQGTPVYSSGYYNRRYWNYPNFQINGILSISGSVSPNLNSLFSLDSLPHAIIDKKILEEEINTDVTILTKDGKSIKCHKCHLSVHSPVLGDMFQGSFEEARTSTVKMDMDEASVKALLAYLYYGGLEDTEKNCAIVFDLFEAGHKYNITQLEELMKGILLSKPDEWFTVDVVLSLYLLARNLEDGANLKIKAVQWIKLNNASITNSSKFAELFKEHPTVAMELYQTTCSL